MLRFVIPVALALCLPSGPAKAQDQVSVDHQRFDWNGLYFGVQAGYGRAGVDQAWSTSDIWTAGGASPTLNLSMGSDNWLWGGHVGYNFVVAPNWLLGVEGSYSPSEYSDSTPGPWFPATDRHRTKIGDVWTMGGRIGYFMDNWLVYASGGAAGGTIEVSSQCPAGCLSSQIAKSREHHNGWTAGGGVEVFVTDHVIFGVDYKHVELDDKNQTPNVVGGIFVSSSRSVGAEIDAVTARLSYKF